LCKDRNVRDFVGSKTRNNLMSLLVQESALPPRAGKGGQPSLGKKTNHKLGPQTGSIKTGGIIILECHSYKTTKNKKGNRGFWAQAKELSGDQPVTGI